MSLQYQNKTANSQVGNEVLLKLENITKRFGGLTAVKDVNLTVNKGDLHCLIGPNGAGKSTIFNIIMGVYQPDQGSIIFKDKDITNNKLWSRAGLGLSIKMQIPGIYGDLTVRDNVKIAGQYQIQSKNIDDEIDRLLDFVGISHLENEYAMNLSHGQQQWLEICMSLASNPNLLLLDEPVAGMGPEETEFTAELVRKLNREGLTILFIDHDMEFVRRLAEKVTVLHQGQVFAEGTIQEIETNERVIDIYLGKA